MHLCVHTHTHTTHQDKEHRVNLRMLGVPKEENLIITREEIQTNWKIYFWSWEKGLTSFTTLWGRINGNGFSLWHTWQSLWIKKILNSFNWRRKSVTNVVENFCSSEFLGFSFLFFWRMIWSVTPPPKLLSSFLNGS